MSDFLESIKITKNEKKNVIYDMILNMMYSSSVLSLEEITDNNKEAKYSDLQKRIKKTLNQNEILAAYSLGREIKIYIDSDKKNELFDYIGLSSNNINKDKMLEFINETVIDIENAKSANRLWSFQSGKILKRLREKETENKDTKISNLSSKKTIKIVNSFEEIQK